MKARRQASRLRERGGSLERELCRLLARHGALLVTVESCTAGAIAERVTRVPGSSEVFWGALVTYQERAKQALLGISARTLARSGAVSARVARAMAEAGYRLARDSARAGGTRRRSPAAVVAVSTTGVAGPGGDGPRTPVGLCYIGVASTRSGGRARVIRVAPETARALGPPGSRSAQKSRFTREAIRAVLRELGPV
jgi:PncC family amidohydrolase